eukprot:6221817-Amphidinium_carterae.2
MNRLAPFIRKQLATAVCQDFTEGQRGLLHSKAQRNYRLCRGAPSYMCTWQMHPMPHVLLVLPQHEARCFG